MKVPGNLKHISAYDIAMLGMMLAVALILSYVESLIPFNFGVPGIKLGLANLCAVIIIYIWGFRQAFLINVLRILLAGFMFGSMSSIIYALSGAVLSMLVMFIVMKTGVFSSGGVSLAGGVAHNIGQCIMACLMVSDYRVSVYLPVLIISGAVTGILIGYTAGLIIPRIEGLLRR